MLKQKLILLIIFLTAASVLPAQARDINFSWLPNAPEQKVTSYQIHYGPSERTYTEYKDVGLPSAVDGRMYATVTIGDDRTCFTAVAVRDELTSDYSNEACVDAVEVPLPDLVPVDDFRQVGENLSIQGCQGENLLSDTWREYADIADNIAPIAGGYHLEDNAAITQRILEPGGNYCVQFTLDAIQGEAEVWVDGAGSQYYQDDGNKLYKFTFVDGDQGIYFKARAGAVVEFTNMVVTKGD